MAARVAFAPAASRVASKSGKKQRAAARRAGRTARAHHGRLVVRAGDLDDELAAINAAIEALNALKRPSSVVLHTDSTYVMHGITEWMANWKKRGWKTAGKKPVKNQDLWIALDEATQRHDIKWVWVKGHSGHDGNEEADALANRGIDEL